MRVPVLAGGFHGAEDGHAAGPGNGGDAAFAGRADRAGGVHDGGSAGDGNRSAFDGTGDVCRPFRRDRSKGLGRHATAAVDRDVAGRRRDRGVAAGLAVHDGGNRAGNVDCAVVGRHGSVAGRGGNGAAVFDRNVAGFRRNENRRAGNGASDPRAVGRIDGHGAGAAGYAARKSDPAVRGFDRSAGAAGNRRTGSHGHLGAGDGNVPGSGNVRVPRSAGEDVPPAERDGAFGRLDADGAAVARGLDGAKHLDAAGAGNERGRAVARRRQGRAAGDQSGIRLGADRNRGAGNRAADGNAGTADVDLSRNREIGNRNVGGRNQREGIGRAGHGFDFVDRRAEIDVSAAEHERRRGNRSVIAAGNALDRP